MPADIWDLILNHSKVDNIGIGSFLFHYFLAVPLFSTFLIPNLTYLFTAFFIPNPTLEFLFIPSTYSNKK